MKRKFFRFLQTARLATFMVLWEKFVLFFSFSLPQTSNVQIKINVDIDAGELYYTCVGKSNSSGNLYKKKASEVVVSGVKGM